MIALLILSILILAAFAAWEWWIERHSRTPPLLPLSVFVLDHGRVSTLCLIAVSQSVAFAREQVGLTTMIAMVDTEAFQLRWFLRFHASHYPIFPRIPRNASKGDCRMSNRIICQNNDEH